MPFSSKPLGGFFATMLAALAAGPTAYADTGQVCLSAAPTVQGDVLGHADEGTCAYKGIPYAAPPVNTLRWQPTQKPPVRDQVFEADNHGSICMQRGVPGAGVISSRSEDCLNLNIWRPQSNGEALPVMVWFHGGGNQIGAGSKSLFDGAKLAASQGVVVVSINYRLGVFGFFGPEANGAVTTAEGSYFPEYDLSHLKGNYGLLDQIAALRWVKDNIAGFRGDPNSVTVFGNSAGANDLCHLLTSPLSEGYFHKAIMQSGGCKHVSTMSEAEARIAETTTLARVPAWRDTVNYLRALSAPTLLRRVAHDLDNNLNPAWAASGAVRFKPYVDGVVLPKQSSVAVSEGDFHRVPVMGGLNQHEQRLFFFLEGEPDEDEAAEYLASLLPQLNASYQDIEDAYGLANFDSKIDLVRKVWGDYAVNCASLNTLEDIARYQPSQTFQYRFDYDDHRLSDALGAAHGLEIGFVFDTLDQGSNQPLYWAEDRVNARGLVEATQEFWANFARTGDPNGDAFFSLWPTNSTAGMNVMKLDWPLGLTDDAHDRARCEVLESYGASF